MAEFLIKLACMCLGGGLFVLLRALVLYWEVFEPSYFMKDSKNWTRAGAFGLVFLILQVLLSLQGDGILDAFKPLGIVFAATASGAVGFTIVMFFFIARPAILRLLGTGSNK